MIVGLQSLINNISTVLNNNSNSNNANYDDKVELIQSSLKNYFPIKSNDDIQILVEYIATNCYEKCIEEVNIRY